MGPQGNRFSGMGVEMGNNRATPPNYSDLDGIRRQGDALSTVSTTSAILVANSRSFSDPQSTDSNCGRAGTVFRDQPWKTLNFTPAESGDAGLLDAFTIFEPNTVFRSDVTAGKLSLNTRQKPVLRAVLAGIATNTNNNTPLITEAQRDGIVDALVLMNVRPANYQ